MSLDRQTILICQRRNGAWHSFLTIQPDLTSPRVVGKITGDGALLFQSITVFSRSDVLILCDWLEEFPGLVSGLSVSQVMDAVSHLRSCNHVCTATECEQWLSTYGFLSESP